MRSTSLYFDMFEGALTSNLERKNLSETDQVVGERKGVFVQNFYHVGLGLFNFESKPWAPHVLVHAEGKKHNN